MLTTRQGAYTADPGSLMFDSATTSTSQTAAFTVPSGIYEITVESRGAGGASRSVNVYSGGGGGGGAYVKATIPVTPFEVLDLVVGAVGTTSTVKRGATTLVSCGAGQSCTADNGVGMPGGLYSTDASVSVLAASNGGTGGNGATGSGATGGAGATGGGAGGGSYNGVGGSGGSGGQFGRGGNPGNGNPGNGNASWGALGATGIDSPGYPGGYTCGANGGGVGTPGLMRISW